jgi:hypothetical protein
MAKRHSNSSAERFVALHHWLLKSPAWRALSSNAKAVLLHVWERHNGSNNAQIVYAVREAKAIGLSKSHAARALSELVDLGFLRVTRSSSFDLKTKEARVWGLTAEPIDGRPPTKDFMRWAQPENKTRSHGRDPQSHGRDRGRKNGPENGSTVPQAGPLEAKSTPPQSHGRDTSILPGGTAPTGEPATLSSTDQIAERRPPKFGDLAKAERTARPPRVLH